MKVDGSGRVQGPGKTSKKKETSKESGDFGAFISSGNTSTSGTKATQSIAHVDALLAVQGAEDPTERAARQRMRQRSNTILGELESLRMAMLHGNLTVGHMIDVADVVASHREHIADPALSAIMDEIDLRAQVELAKMRVVLDQASH